MLDASFLPSCKSVAHRCGMGTISVGDRIYNNWANVTA